MNTLELPARDEMLVALMARDAAYDGVFVAAIRTTGIFCRPSCTARKPDPRNVRFFPSPGEAQAAGFRPCLRCRPLEVAGETPAWIATLLRDVEAEPAGPAAPASRSRSRTSMPSGHAYERQVSRFTVT